MRKSGEAERRAQTNVTNLVGQKPNREIGSTHSLVSDIVMEGRPIEAQVNLQGESLRTCDQAHKIKTGLLMGTHPNPLQWN